MYRSDLLHAHIFTFPVLLLLTHPAITDIYTLSLHDALPISDRQHVGAGRSRSGRRWLRLDLADGPLLSDRGEASVVRCASRSEEHTSELQSRRDLVCRLLLEKKKTH